KILSWLSPVLFEARQRQLQELHEAGTGSWLPDHATFERWKSEKGSRLWCSGIPGAGKTFMASLVIKTLQHSDIPVVFIFADYKDHSMHTSLDLLSSITRQLAMHCPAVIDLVYPKYENQLAHSTAEDNAATRLHRLYVVIDALDEIPSTEESRGSDVRTELMSALVQLDYVSIFCTTRPHIDSSLYFQSPLQLHIEAKDSDLRLFLEARMSSASRLSRILSKDRYLKEDIITTITKKASGM
ncbi:hypothetical protein BU23DRAFT_372625, partial [Bimuria novae-zelandiae CBS 107.79]